MFPVEAPDLRERILGEILPAYLRDNVKARIVQPDGTHTRVTIGEHETRHRCQEELLAVRPGMLPIEANSIESNGAAAFAAAIRDS